MAAAIANTQTYENVGTGTGQTMTGYTPAAGSNRILVVRVHGLRTSESGAFTVDSVTFGGVALTQAVTESTTSTSRTYRAAMWYLLNPSSSTGDIVVTFSHASNSTIIVASTLTGVAQTSPIGATDTDYNDGSIAYLTLQLTGTFPSGSLALYMITTHCNNNPTFSWTSPFTEEYDIRTAANTSTEVAGSGGWRDSYLTDENRPEPTQAWPKCGVAALFKAAATAITATAADTLDLAGSTARRGIYRKTAAETLDLADTAPRRAIYRRTAADLLDALEATARSGIYRQTLSDNAGLSASLTPRRILRMVATESLGLSSGLTPRNDFRTTLSDLLDILETAAGGSRIEAGADDALDVTDSGAPGYIIRRVAADTWQLAPAATRRADFVTTVSDALDMTEVAAYPLPADFGQFEIEPYEDSLQGSDGVINITNNENSCNASNPYNALEFRDIDVPRFAIPTAAYLKLYVITNDDPGLTVRAEKTPSPAALSTTTNDISSRTPLTTAGVEWSAANIGTNAYKNSPDLTAVLQEVFALEGWTRNESDLMLILSNNGTGGSLRYGTSEASSDKRPKLYVEWYIGGVTLTATAADVLAMMEDATRRAIIAAATVDSYSMAAATTVALSLLVSDSLHLAETIATLARLSIGDVALLGDAVYMTYALSLTEPVDFSEALQRIATWRSNIVDVMRYVETVGLKVGTTAGDTLELSAALAARRLFAAVLVDPLRYQEVLSGDYAGLLEAIVNETLGLGAMAAAGWSTTGTAEDDIRINETTAALRHFLATALDAGLIGDVAAIIMTGRVTAADSAALADSLRTLMRTRAVDTLEITDSALSAVVVMLQALAADVMSLSEGLNSIWRITAHDRLDFVATVGTIMHWVESVQDELGLAGVAVFLLPNGIVRIEFSINEARIAFDIVMPRVDFATHGLIEE